MEIFFFCGGGSSSFSIIKRYNTHQVTSHTHFIRNYFNQTVISSPVATPSITVHGTPVFPFAIAIVRLFIPNT
ncbi:hypothetical protein DERP_010930 [Dermatophagoides pteronyssinus]|uniref:Uncharacterized protein n=1 Tax=Dermatophagoides pteronyssinus TaxID=6956 RepID=A0ABQ8JUV6_DERPT|nr:hypothetical protein DERP_010930 [Dermatophagoides pteronyssinus]